MHPEGAAGVGPLDLLTLYEDGVFPMAETAGDPTLYVIDPEERGVLPIKGFHVPRKLKKTVRRDRYLVTLNRDFPSTIALCAESVPGRPDTWINRPIIELYNELHRLGHAHSVEAWDAISGQLAGGLYGVSLGGAFFGESMFHRMTDASKVALVHLTAWLGEDGFVLHDAQFWNDHLAQFGMQRIDRATFRSRLAEARAQTDVRLRPLPDRVRPYGWTGGTVSDSFGKSVDSALASNAPSATIGTGVLHSITQMS